MNQEESPNGRERARGWDAAGVVGSARSKQLSRDGRRKDESRGWGHRSSQAEGQLCTLLPTLHVQDLVKHRPTPIQQDWCLPSVLQISKSACSGPAFCPLPRRPPAGRGQVPSGPLLVSAAFHPIRFPPSPLRPSSRPSPRAWCQTLPVILRGKGHLRSGRLSNVPRPQSL